MEQDTKTHIQYHFDFDLLPLSSLGILAYPYFLVTFQYITHWS